MNIRADVAGDVVDWHAHYAAILRRTRAAPKKVKAAALPQPVVEIEIAPSAVEETPPKAKAIRWHRPPVEQNAHVIDWLQHKLAEEQGRAVIKTPPKPAAIIRRVIADYPDVTFEDVIGPRRCKNIVRVRHLAIRAVKSERPDLSYPQIGRIFNRDHTSVLNAVKYSRAVL